MSSRVRLVPMDRRANATSGRSDWFTVEEASEILDVSPQYVRKLLAGGKLAGSKLGGRWITSIEALNSIELASEVGTINPPDIARKSRAQRSLKSLSFFTGAMGLDLGLERVGIEPILACEVDPAARATIRRNRPDLALIGDIRDYSAQRIREAALLGPDEEIDLVVGGPPCQAFSSAGRRQGFSDERGNVFLEFIDRALELRPKFIVIENVRGLLSAALKHRPINQRGKNFPSLSLAEQPGSALFAVLRRLRAAGYGVSFNLYNAANFGSAQKRERIVIVCSRDGTVLQHLRPTHSETGEFRLPAWRTVAEAFQGLEDVTHEHVNFPERRLRYYRLLGPGQYWRHLPPQLQEEALGKAFYSGGGKTGFMRRIAWDEPSPTLVTHPAMPATDLCHPEENRPLSIQEYMRLQDFPDDWFVEGTLLDKYRQIGNAVPGRLGSAIGQLLLNHLSGENPTPPLGFRFSRYNHTDERSWEEAFRERVSPSEQVSLFELVS